MPLNPAAARWLFFDLGYTLINEDAAAAERLRQLSHALRTRGIHAPPADIRAALDAAAARFEPNPFGNAIRAFTQDDEIIQFARNSGRYPKELETPYPQARALLERLSQRYMLGVIANQPPGTAERLAAYGLSRLLRRMRIIRRRRREQARPRHIPPGIGRRRLRPPPMR